MLQCELFTLVAGREHRISLCTSNILFCHESERVTIFELYIHFSEVHIFRSRGGGVRSCKDSAATCCGISMSFSASLSPRRPRCLVISFSASLELLRSILGTRRPHCAVINLSASLRLLRSFLGTRGPCRLIISFSASLRLDRSLLSTGQIALPHYQLLSVFWIGSASPQQ